PFRRSRTPITRIRIPARRSAGPFRPRVGGPERAALRKGRFLHSFYGAVQTQFAASLRSPVPLYLAYCGYAHNGRDRPELLLVAAISAGAVPFSRHFSSVPIVSNESGPSPPRQCP